VHDRYNISKLLEIYTVRELATLTSASQKPGKVIINCLNPGFVYTNVMREFSGITLLLFRGMRAILARSTEVGSRTLVNGAEGGEETHGQYLDDCKVAK